MTIHAYPEIYLNDAQSVLGDAFDYAVNSCMISGEDFVKLFAVSSVSKRMEAGEPACVAGKSGQEIAALVLEETTDQTELPDYLQSVGRSVEYWIGWAIAYYQWYSDRKYIEIFDAISFDELSSMYETLHEADITKFVEIADAKVREHFSETNLKRIRVGYGCTQAELAALSGVNLELVQMYEQRDEDINQASVETVYRLSKVLGCSMESLMEK